MPPTQPPLINFPLLPAPSCCLLWLGSLKRKPETSQHSHQHKQTFKFSCCCQPITMSLALQLKSTLATTLTNTDGSHHRPASHHERSEGWTEVFGNLNRNLNDNLKNFNSVTQEEKSDFGYDWRQDDYYVFRQVQILVTGNSLLAPNFFFYQLKLKLKLKLNHMNFHLSFILSLGKTKKGHAMQMFTHQSQNHPRSV